MTAIAEHTESAPVTRPKNRTFGVVRLQFTNTQTFVWVPLLVLVGMWLITLIVYWIIASSGVDSPMYSGGSQGPLWYFAVVGAQAMNLTFYFSQAMSLTRREFYLGSLLAAAISAVGISTAFVLLGLIEQSTEGYGINGYFAYLPWVWEHGPFAAGFIYFVLTMLWFVLGFWFAIVNKRFGALILTASIIAIVLILLAGAAWVSFNRAWPEVWMWFADAQAIGLALWAFGLSVVFALGSYLTLRRLTT
ncbi:hypothetical protein BI49514_02422 [Brevibacterium iodinum ATCC 49514]|uniref:Uncharacterized protein n=1 Tax=Brevibacterium iodinum ATCC 49514 TaxID=1255616 RepID=A0A2H1JVZ0_9MICO|nr:hypothetical protein [Brevibacterium iodinum]SMX91621.1 hypothetical protein BI49514_02422 [Brevibacterium iodinum ATCC 49514]SUW11571.1 Uncharacterised protein [Brevibacterium iodinum]